MSQVETPLNIAVLTLSDSRTLAEDKSGDYLVSALETAGHQLADRQLIPDDVYQMRAVVSQWIADPAIQVILTTGGTGFTGRDSTPEALRPLFDTEIEGFGETFRQVSYAEIGSSTVQSRCLAGLANATAIFCLPGSTGACRTGWTKILHEQLDSRHRPCNFVGILLHGKQLHS
ncbi:molybdenum cofactor biosynthesis protein B [Marinospirillum celere]|uniref:Molybdenum cofactor biosynthesis protein B n=1 Tax=Marinospirillum celere TaxID=1122252 RepID=A0A1I1HY16_9GAMM|nr:molybdenum cofactor biosynthesis protein B [Marinospirillum celere]SFC28834.1 molybdenum cofactor biosynthesis protein B [Marinospirillum celere]